MIFDLSKESYKRIKQEALFKLLEKILIDSDPEVAYIYEPETYILDFDVLFLDKNS